MKKIITYGTYDLLHQGHINLLSKREWFKLCTFIAVYLLYLKMLYLCKCDDILK